MKKGIILLLTILTFINCSDDKNDNDIQATEVNLSSVVIPFDTARRLFGQMTFEESDNTIIENISIVISDDLNFIEEKIDVQLNYNDDGVIETMYSTFTDFNDELIGSFTTTFTNDGENLIASVELPLPEVNNSFIFSYDDQNRIVEITNNAKILTFDYNSINNVNSVTSSRSSDNFLISSLDFEFDDNTNPLNELNISKEALIIMYSFFDIISFDEILIPLSLSNNNNIVFNENIYNENNLPVEVSGITYEYISEE